MTRMHQAVVAALVAVALAFAGCGDDDGNVISIDEDDLTPDTTVVVRTPAPTTAPTRPAPTGDAVEVQGIIGVIDRDTATITINPLQGTTVDTIAVAAGTVIRSAGGREITLEELRISDRIIATGVVEDGVLVAEEIAISQVVPGSEPGG